MRSIILPAFLLVALPFAAVADDGAASLATGSIVFTHIAPVRMKAEDLYVSPVKVRVRFEFANDTEKDFETVVAFPLPDIDVGNYWTEALGTITDDPVNFVGFTARVEGAPIHFQVEQRAISIKTKQDVTTLIKKAGLPVNMLTPSRTGAFYKLLKSLPPAKLKKLIDAGALDPGWQGLPGYPYWTMQTRFFWTQRFPAHKTVMIEHSYQPISGSYNSASYFTEDRAGAPFCVDAPTRADIQTLVHTHDKAQSSSVARYTDYILKTAKTWNGPIGRFHLTLDKLKPENVLSLCWDGSLKKTGPTTFEFTRTNFTPVRDINLLVLE
jgi:hypothetical protein